MPENLDRGIWTGENLRDDQTNLLSKPLHATWRSPMRPPGPCFETRGATSAEPLRCAPPAPPSQGAEGPRFSKGAELLFMDLPMAFGGGAEGR
jgi:hypothetical protein